MLQKHFKIPIKLFHMKNLKKLSASVFRNLIKRPLSFMRLSKKTSFCN